MISMKHSFHVGCRGDGCVYEDDQKDFEEEMNAQRMIVIRNECQRMSISIGGAVGHSFRTTHTTRCQILCGFYVNENFIRRKTATIWSMLHFVASGGGGVCRDCGTDAAPQQSAKLTNWRIIIN